MCAHSLLSIAYCLRNQPITWQLLQCI